MAKFARVTYGSHGDTKEYTYVVNDNVRTGDYINPSVKHYISGTIFGTLGIVQSTAKQNASNTAKVEEELAKRADETGKQIHLAELKTGREVGAKFARGEKGQFNEKTGLGRPVKGPDNRYAAPEGSQYMGPTKYQQAARAANVAFREQQEARYQSFEEYSAPFIKGNNNENL